MSLILAWVAFPLVMAAVGAGWGVLVEHAAGTGLGGALLVPVGLATALVLAGTLTAFAATAAAAVPVVGAGGAIGLALAIGGMRHREPESPGASGPAAASGAARRRPSRAPIGRWPAIAAVGVLLVYGAPVLLSGSATFTGFIKLDDTSTWLNVVDIVFAHGRSVASLPLSTYSLTFTGDIGEAYPLGAFMLLGLGHGLTGIDAAWIFQPYLACCGASLALCIYSLLGGLMRSPRLRALVAFLGAQPALLYGYSLWGGIKEMSAAFTLALGVALISGLLRRRAERRMHPLAELRAMLPLAIAAGAFMQVLGIGGGGWAAPALLLFALAWVGLGWRAGALLRRLASLAGLAALTAAAVIPVLVVLAYFLGHDQGLFSEGQSTFTRYGTLTGPISGWQLAGIWPVGDFRQVPAWYRAIPLIALVVVMAAAGVALAVRRRRFGVPLYVAVALGGVAVVDFGAGATPWVVGKSLAIASPALLTAALAAAGMLLSARRGLPAIAGAAQSATDAPPGSPGAKGRGGRFTRGFARARVLVARGHRTARPPGAPAGGRGVAPARVAGAIAMLCVGGGVLWSNVLAYGSATLAPRARLAELQHIGGLLKGKGPTFVNMYEVYADRHFLREGAPTEPAEYRAATLPLRNGAILTKSAWADLNSFGLATLEPYRSIVTQRTPAESRPPSIYQLVYRGRFFELWQRPADPTTRILEHIPYGESNTRPFCGVSQNDGTASPCSVDPVAVPPCPQVHSLARKAALEHAHLLAYQQPRPTATYGDDVLWPPEWIHSTANHSLEAVTSATAVGHVDIPSSQRYELWLGGGFARGFQVRVDGRPVGTVSDELALFTVYAPVAALYLPAGVHTIEYTYPGAGLGPGSAWNEFTSLSAVLFQPLQFPRSEMISVTPGEAGRLCGRDLNWIEIVSGR